MASIYTIRASLRHRFAFGVCQITPSREGRIEPGASTRHLLLIAAAGHSTRSLEKKVRISLAEFGTRAIQDTYFVGGGSGLPPAIIALYSCCSFSLFRSSQSVRGLSFGVNDAALRPRSDGRNGRTPTAENASLNRLPRAKERNSGRVGGLWQRARK